MTDETTGEGPIDEEELPNAGNSNAKLYPTVEDAQGDQPQEDEQQATHGDAAAVRDGDGDAGDAGPEPNE